MRKTRSGESPPNLPEPAVSTRLKALEAEVRAKGQFHMTKEGLFRGVLKGAFIKAYEFVRYTYNIEPDSANEGSFFAASALRGICEDLIALKFLSRLTKEERNEVTAIKMLSGTVDASVKQSKFFKKKRPFQPVLHVADDPVRHAGHRSRLTAIGQASGLWRTDGKLPPIEQMAMKVNLRWLYDFIYSATSEVVHFSPRIALRNGWGTCTLPAHHSGGHLLATCAFSTRNFCRYYLDFSRTYGLYVFVLFALTFRRNLALSESFVGKIRELQSILDDELRWPEAVTFEEMNQKEPGPILRILMRVVHHEKRGRKPKKPSSRTRPKSSKVNPVSSTSSDQLEPVRLSH